MSRNQDASNGGRRIENEDMFFQGLRKLLRQRKRGEQLVLFDRRKFNSIAEVSSYFSQNVSAIIAPHGSALHNARFASAGTLIVEFMPKGRFQPCFWEQARLMDQNYMVYMADSLNSQHDMKIDDIPKVLRKVNSMLGKEYAKDEFLKSDYPWKVDA